ncbi:MAG: DNA-directed RNA polymerase subunit L [Thermoprotei archaeon]|nr:MAG: DNA-directed RNA polymerase subunit L [Thermoprotei archaeon]
MEVELRKLARNEVVIRLAGEDHTLGNLIAKMALRHPNVKMAAYTIEHPLNGSPVIRIITDGRKDSIVVLREVLSEARSLSLQLLKVLESRVKALKVEGSNV